MKMNLKFLLCVSFIFMVIVFLSCSNNSSPEKPDLTETFVSQSRSISADTETLGLNASTVSSSDNSIATAVLKDKIIIITSISKGEVTITASEGDKSALISVTITESGSINVNITKYKVTFVSQIKTISVNVETLGIDATSVNSSNTNVATVFIENNLIKITSKSEGTVTVTASDGLHSATISVTVSTSGNINVIISKYIEEKDNNCFLSKIDYSCGFLSPDFNKETYSYILFIPNDINEEQIVIIPTTESTKATVSNNYRKNLSEISSSDYATFTVTAENSQTKIYSIRVSRYDRNVVLTYNWSLDSKQVSVTNLSNTKSYYILATSSPIRNELNNHDFALLEINKELKPSETLLLNAYEPTNLTSKPSILFSTDKGKIFEYSPAQAGQGIDYFIEILFLDYRETYNGEISEFSEMYSISEQEDKYGNYSTFSWTNRNKGQYKITGNDNKQLMKAYIGNIRGVTHSGDSTYLKAIRYYIGEKTKWNEWKNSIIQ